MGRKEAAQQKRHIFIFSRGIYSYSQEGEKNKGGLGATGQNEDMGEHINGENCFGGKKQTVGRGHKIDLMDGNTTTVGQTKRDREIESESIYIYIYTYCKI